MSKLLVFSYSGFSDSSANGITMKNLLSAFLPEETAQFYCDVQQADFTAAHRYFRVTDTQMLKAFFGKKFRQEFVYEGQMPQNGGKSSKAPASPKKLPAWLKKFKYNFAVKWTRENLWRLSPWGHRQLKRWIREFAPDVIVYMVGESIFMDKLVMQACRDTGAKFVAYNGEAYRIIDLSKRHGLERAYYRRTHKLYEKLHGMADLVIYSCPMIQEDFRSRYGTAAKEIIAYNSAACDKSAYLPGNGLGITYFGNLGVGRSDTLLQVADVLAKIDPALRLDIYGNAKTEDEKRFNACENIRYHGFVDAATLHKIVENSDILLHVESFDEAIVPKLRYAFSTKIAQCLCAGRCFISYAPAESASSRYLAQAEGAVLVSDEAALEEILRRVIESPALRQEYAQKAARTGLENHHMQTTARRVRKEIEAIL